MEQQLSIWDIMAKVENSLESEPTSDEILTEDELHYIRENLLLETCKSAFGLSRGGNKRKPSEEAWNWILSEDRKLPFSFDQCCQEFNADPDTVREMFVYYRRKFIS